MTSVMSFSFKLNRDKTVSLHEDWTLHPYESDYLEFVQAASDKIENTIKKASIVSKNEQILSSALQNQSEDKTELPDTVVYPLIQMGPLGIQRDEAAILTLLGNGEPGRRLLLTTGYFNLTTSFATALVEHSRAYTSVLMASPQANGFLGARGIAGAIPYSYIYLANQFLNRVHSRNQTSRISLVEYYKENWTFHGKGMWCYLTSKELPSLTVIGSPNYGYRSVKRDLECEVAIVTENKKLQKQLQDEHQHMYSTSSPVTESTFKRDDRYVALWIRAVTSIIKRFF